MHSQQAYILCTLGGFCHNGPQLNAVLKLHMQIC